MKTSRAGMMHMAISATMTLTTVIAVDRISITAKAADQGAEMPPLSTEFTPLTVMHKDTERAYLAYDGKPLFAFGPMN
ncbi:MAG: hypothetical protein GXY44_09165, partial [Phycisphaerales bacterium]|nr:hypothetical protein [Phycisphaerales bacterium]